MYEVILNEERECPIFGVAEDPLARTVRFKLGDRLSLVGGSGRLHVEDGAGERSAIAFERGRAEYEFACTGPHYLWLKEGGARELCVVESVARRPTSALVMSTVISQRLGPFKAWPESLRIIARQKFNAVHFTPIQKLGESRSSYAIAEHLSLALGDWDELEVALRELRDSHGILPFTDLVLNHAAHDAPFFREHPQAGYNELNSPWLRGAVELDEALKQFNRDVVAGRHSGVGPHVHDQHQLDRLACSMEEHCLKPFRLHEWFTLDIHKCVALFEQSRDRQAPKVGDPDRFAETEALKLVGTCRNHLVLPLDVLSRLTNDSKHLQHILGRTQERLSARKNEVYQQIVQSFRGTVNYERIQSKKGPVDNTPWNSFVPWYFTPIQAADGNTYHLANNGWVLNWSAKDDFTAPGTLVYLSRSLVAWSDCVKLRYGDSPSSSPALWNMMEKYCATTAKYFSGVRLDNCHSTPIHVGKHMLAAARKVNPNLFVFAELFTGNQLDDVIFEEELGLDTLVREALQTSSPGDQAWHAFKFSQLKALGEVPNTEVPLNVDTHNKLSIQRRRCCNIFYDCTHDNETPFQKNRPHDTLACAAIVAASGCGVGSVLGYEVCVRRNPSVVIDGKLYPKWRVAETTSDRGISEESTGEQSNRNDLVVEWAGPAGKVVLWGDFNGWSAGIEMEKQSVNSWKLSVPGVSKGDKVIGKFVVDGAWQTSDRYEKIRDENGNENNILSCELKVTNTDSRSRQIAFDASVGIVEARRVLNQIHQLMAEQGFDEIKLSHLTDDTCVISRYSPGSGEAYHFIIRSYWWRGPDRPPFHEVYVEGEVASVELCCLTALNPSAFSNVSHDDFGIAGESSCVTPLRSPDVRYDGSMNRSALHFSSLPSGSVCVIRTVMQRPDTAILRALTESLEDALLTINLEQLNALLWSSEPEERDRTTQGVYQFPGSSKDSVFAGFAGVMEAINEGRKSPSNGPIYENVKAGNWLIDYHERRLSSLESTSMTASTPGYIKLKDLFQKCCEAIRSCSLDSLKPSAVDYLFSTMYRSLIHRLLTVCHGAGADPLMKALMIASTQVVGCVPSSRLPNVSTRCSMAAGLPFFTTEYMREWGRDTMIAFNGIYIAPGRFEEAEATLLAYASVIRHALVPNLLDSGNNPRYNARDATWFWVQAVQDHWRYCDQNILDHTVNNQYPDQGLPFPTKPLNTVMDCIKHILGAHAKGFQFREWNAGERIDAHMKDQGFNINIKFEHGFCLGGNRWNCGTWMDKMGSSDYANNRGHPSSPRDGAPIELTAAIYSALKWIVEELQFGNEILWYNDSLTYAQWKQLIEANFKKYYWIPKDNQHHQNVAVPETYKDVYGGEQEDEDYFLRCNYSYAFSIAPTIDDPERIRKALEIAYKELVCETDQVGMKTLNPSNYRYRPNYDNSDQSSDKNVAHGWNYHQGPEWVWPMGAWFQAMLKNIRIRGGDSNEVQTLMEKLKNVRKWINKSPWYSLPELMDSNGRVCIFSCQSQAWSIGTFLWFFKLLMESDDKFSTPEQLSQPSTTP